MPRFRYRLSRDRQPVYRGGPLWNARLPLDRPALFGGACEDDFRYGDYFQAARTFLERNRCEALTRAAGLQLQRPVCAGEIAEVRIFLEKHGQFYHPSRIETVGADFAAAFVLNVALSATGREWFRTEFDTISRLNREFPGARLPAVYACGEVRSRKNGRSLGMFLGEWFDGFNEFHASRDPETGQEKVIVWDYAAGDYFLTPAQTVFVYKEAARILTGYYNVATFEQIFSWHHAAGDFVVRSTGGGLDVRLITARQYLKLIRDTDRRDKTPALMLRGLLVFFLYLSIRMRLDRRDGTGPLVWLGLEALEGTVAGFCEALAQKAPIATLPVSLPDGFRACLQALAPQDLLELLGDIAASYAPASPDAAVIREHLAQHAEELRQALRRIGA